MRRPGCGITRLQERAILLVANGVVLLLLAFALLLLKQVGYHPMDAGDPFLALPLWLQVLWLAGTFGLIEAVILWNGKRA